MAATTNLFIDQGSDFGAEVELLQDDGTPMNLADATPLAQMKRSYYSLTSYAFQASVLEAANGKIKLAMTGANSKLLKPGRYVYDVLLTQFAGNTRVLEGVVTIYPEVTV